MGGMLTKPGFDIRDVQTILPRRRLVTQLHFSTEVLEPLEIGSALFLFF